MLASLALLAPFACGGGRGSSDVGAPQAIPDIGTFPPMANDAPPGASATAISTAAAIGRGVNFGNMLEAPSEGACVREGLLNSLLGS